jgi:hypothetical protein
MALLKVLQIPCYDVNTDPPDRTRLWVQAKTDRNNDFDVICLMAVYYNGDYYPLGLKGGMADEPIPIHDVMAWCYYPNTLVQH